MVHRDRVGRGEAAIGIAASSEASDMAGNNVLTRGVLRPLISDPGATADSAAAAELKRVADAIDRNLPPHLHRREIPAGRDAHPLLTLHRLVYPTSETRQPIAKCRGNQLASFQTECSRSIQLPTLPALKKFM